MRTTIKITLEDDDELFSCENPPAIVPVVISNGRYGVEAELYFGVYDQVSEFIHQNKETLFEDETLLALNDLIAPYLEQKGYVREKQGTLRWYHSFAAYDYERIDTDLILPNTKKLNTLRYENRTTFDLAELKQHKLPAFVSIVNGAVVSIATVNPYSKGQRMLEITAETAPEYRKRGFGASNVAALANYLLTRRHTVAYCCSRHNRGSVKIARKVGFTNEGKFYAIDAYRKDVMERGDD